jgi:hypothetical protein
MTRRVGTTTLIATWRAPQTSCSAQGRPYSRYRSIHVDQEYPHYTPYVYRRLNLLKTSFNCYNFILIWNPIMHDQFQFLARMSVLSYVYVCVWLLVLSEPSQLPCFINWLIWWGKEITISYKTSMRVLLFARMCRGATCTPSRRRTEHSRRMVGTRRRMTRDLALSNATWLASRLAGQFWGGRGALTHGSCLFAATCPTRWILWAGTTGMIPRMRGTCKQIRL